MIGLKRIILAVAGGLIVLQLGYLACVAFGGMVLRGRNPERFSLDFIRERQTGQSRHPLIAVTLDEVPLLLLHTLVIVEDPRFAVHRGVDFGSIRFALALNRRHGRKLYGGSTITQQLSRTLFLFPRKLYLRKLLEMQAAVVLEAILPKERILELYINYAEWGPGVYGIGAASHYHYGKDSASLSPSEIADLLTILAGPLRFTPESIDQSAMLTARSHYVREVMEAVDQPEQKVRVRVRNVS
jgi:monofunctional glycosyltransferase